MKPANPPAPRTDHSFVRYYNQFFVYGGRDETHIFQDIHKYEIGSNSWTQIETNQLNQTSAQFKALQNTGKIPAYFELLMEPKLRFGHTAIVNLRFMYVFGGWDGNVTLNDLSVFDLDNHIWLQPKKFNGNIEGRYRHTACASQRAMYIFGGINLAQKRFSDIHEYVFDTQTWARRISMTPEPSPRTFHQSVMLDGRFLFIFGGFDGMKRNDLYCAQVEPESVIGPLNAKNLAMLEEQKHYMSDSDAKSVVSYNSSLYSDEYFKSMPMGQWFKLASSGQVFSPRTGHECIFYKENVYLFGGTDDEERLNDMYKYNIKYNHWEKVLYTGTPPLPRSGARGVAFDDKLIFFGGYQRKRGTYFNDLFAFNVEKKEWSEIKSKGQPPSQRTDHTVVEFEGSIYVFAGYDGKQRYNDLVKCSLKQNKFKWKHIETEGSKPLNRFGHAAVVCNNSMFVIGGWNGHETMDDIYQYSFPSNLWFEIRRLKGVRPKPRYRHCAVAFTN